MTEFKRLLKSKNLKESENVYFRNSEIGDIAYKIIVNLVGSIDDYDINSLDPKTKSIILKLEEIRELCDLNESFLYDHVQ